MKNYLIRTMSAAAIVLAVHSGVFAQFSLGLQGGVARSDAEDAKSVYGGGINLRVFASPQFALGVAGKIYADNRDYNVVGQNIDATGALIPLTGTVDYYFTDGVIKPYIGGDAGVYLSKYKVKLNDETIFTSDRRSNFGAAPRVGIIFAFGKVGIQVEGIYHFIFGNEDYRNTTGSANNIDFESTSNAYGVNVGLIFGLGGGNK